MKRSKHSLSHHKLLSCEMGELIPCGLVEVLPGDSFQMSTRMLVRLSPMLAPVMHPVEVRIHHWFVPHRLVWDNFEKFITGGPDGADTSVPPYRNLTGGITEGTLGDYYGVPPGFGNLQPSALPFRGYNLIYNEWYRDQDLVPELPVLKTDGVDATAFAVKMAAWEKDYFTSARPWPMKGPEIVVPLGDRAPVMGIASAAGTQYNQVAPGGKQADGSTPTGNNWRSTNTADQHYIQGNDTTKVPDVWADLSDASGITVAQLRELMALQRMAEARAQFGSRYSEYLRYYGIRSSDARLQRPEYLGGGRQTLQFSEVLQTGVTTDGDDSEGVGNLKGHGIGAVRSNRWRRFFEEHGYIHTFLSVRPKTMYMQGLPRTFNRRTKEDYFQKELAHIGQQEVLKKEIYCGVGDLDATWGYQDRYDEYRRQESSVAGQFRSSLNFWHMAREFSGAPTLNQAFVSMNPTKRIFAVTDPQVDSLWIMAHHSIQARRMVPKVARSFIY